MTRWFRNILLLTAAVTAANAQNFDTSGTAGLSGQYLFRYVNFLNTDPNSNVESCSLTGVISFDGKGSYTVSSAQIYDSSGNSAGSCSNLGGGTYGVQSNGMMQMDNPMFGATLYGASSQSVLTASSTEDGIYDLFVAVQSPTTPFTNASLNGSYTLGSIEFPGVGINGDSTGQALTHQAYFTLTADGNGNIAPITLNGSAENLTATNVTQNVSGVTYTLSGATGGTLTVPNSNNSQLVSGTKILYVSADGNYIVGGSATSADMIFGFRASTTASNSLLSGTYYIAGMDADLGSSSFLDAFYGSINANGAGALLWHERLDDLTDGFTYDDTFNTSVNIASNGTYNDGTYTTLTGFNGEAALTIGSGSTFSFNILVKSPNFTPTSGVWINPIGITNAANFTPITNAYAPGELVNLYGNFNVSTQVDTALPVTTNLGGVQVLVNGTPAPVYLVSANQISALVPYAVSQDYFATFQVVVNGSQSNSVTVYADESSPAIYTIGQNGLGTGAILHSNFTAVNDASPAVPGETVSVYLNGLGTVTPTVADGAPGPTNPLSYSDEFNAGYLSMYLDDYVDTPIQANVTYAGLAPGFPGLYQINFTIPTSTRVLGNGHVNMSLNTYEGVTEMATISLKGFSHASGVAELPARTHPELQIARAAKAKATLARRTKGSTARATKDVRRALPERVIE